MESMQGDDHSSKYGKQQHKAIKSSGAIAAGIGELARQHKQGGAPIQETGDASGIDAMENTKNSKISMRDILGILAIVAPIVLSILGLSAQLSSRIDSLSAQLSSRIDSLSAETNSRIDSLSAETNSRIDSLSAETNSRIDSLSAETNDRFDSINMQLADLRVIDTDIDNKLNAIGQMIILARGNGEITEAELVSIWESVGTE